MTTSEDQEPHWEDLAVKAQDLARAGRPDDGAELLSQVPAGHGFSGYVHETALAWIEIGRAYLGAGRDREVDKSISEAIRAIDQLDAGGTWEAGACRLALASLLAAGGDVAGASILATRVAADSAPLQDQDIDCMKNVRAAARLLASLGRIEEAGHVLALLNNEAIRSEELARLSQKRDLAD
jgi:hypothetical protein